MKSMALDNTTGIRYARHLRLQVIEAFMDIQDTDFVDALEVFSHWYPSQVGYYWNLVEFERFTTEHGTM